MDRCTFLVKTSALFLFAGSFIGATASAAIVQLSASTTAAGTVDSGVTTGLAVPGSYTYSNSFGAGSGATPILGSTSGFFDDFIFTIGAATTNTITSTIDLGSLLKISDLQVALFSLAPGETLPVYGTTRTSGTEVHGWSSPLTSGGSVSGIVSVLPDTSLSGGTYVLEVRGLVSGSAGGSYAGVINLAPPPVPLPAALPLLVSALGGLGLLRRRRKSSLGDDWAGETRAA